MKKLLNIVAAAAVMISAGAALAQTGNGSDVTGGTVSSTIGGLYTPSGHATGGTFTAPSATPVTIPGGGAPAVAGVMAGTPAAVAAFTGGLTSAGIPAAAAQGIANALTSLEAGGSVTFGNVATAVNSWNTAIASLSRPQLQALMRSPQGRAAYQTLRAARAGATRAGNRLS
jgi:hypothetical protein